MRKYTAKEKRQLESNPYTYKVTDHRLMFTVEFKKDFWRKYEAGETPRSILTELGYDTDMFGQKQIDSMVQSMKKQAASGMFREGAARDHRAGRGKKPDTAEDIAMTEENFSRLWHELQYLREEVELLKKSEPAGAAVMDASHR